MQRERETLPTEYSILPTSQSSQILVVDRTPTEGPCKPPRDVIIIESYSDLPSCRCTIHTLMFKAEALQRVYQQMPSSSTGTHVDCDMTTCVWLLIEKSCCPLVGNYKISPWWGSTSEVLHFKKSKTWLVWRARLTNNQIIFEKPTVCDFPPGLECIAWL